MKRRDFIKFAGAVPFAISQLKLIGMSKPLHNTPEATTALNPTSCSHLLSDLSMGDHFVVGGRPGMGKTTLALNILQELAVKKNSGCAFFSIEIAKEQLMQRLLCINSNVSINRMRAGQLSATHFQQVVKSSSGLSKSNIFIDDTACISVEEINRRLHKLKKSGKDIKYVFVDYFQLLDAEKKYACRRDHVDDALLQLKQLAKSHNVIVISLAQLNRSQAYRIDRRPVLTDLRETKDHSNIDKAVFLYRQDYYDHTMQNSPLEMIVVKNKNYKKSVYTAAVNKNSLRIYKFTMDAMGNIC